MIKAHKPRYNIDLKDDKTYVRIKITASAEWPSISVTRRVVSDGSRYFGPYSSAQATRRTLSAIGRIFPVRRCKDTEFANRTRPCIFHSIGLCLAPCVYRHVRNDYDQAVRDLVAFLEGRDRDLVRTLHERMERASNCSISRRRRRSGTRSMPSGQPWCPRWWWVMPGATAMSSPRSVPGIGWRWRSCR